MIRLVIRFFVICFVITVLSIPVILYSQNYLTTANDMGNIKLTDEGKFVLLDRLLLPKPPQEWQTILDQIRPVKGYRILAVPIDKLSLSKQQLNSLKNGEIVVTTDILNNDSPVTVYRRIGNTAYSYRHPGSFSTFEEAHRIFEWQNFMVIKNLMSLPENQWSNFLTETAKLYGYPLTLGDANKFKLSASEKQLLAKNEWVIDLPDKTADSTQILYTAIPHSNKVLKYGPIYLPFAGVYKTQILFFVVFILNELVIFIFAILFARSLEKMNRLANEFGRGNFASPIALSKTSNLYPLYDNLRSMGKRIQSLIHSHRELTNTIAHELRTPISRVRFSLELLKDENDGDIRQQRILTVEDDLKELEDLVSEILVYSTLDRIGPQLKLQSIRLREFLEATENKFRLLLQKNSFVINLAPETRDVIIHADRKYFHRVLQNLLQNANHYADSYIQVSVQYDNSHRLQLIVEDDGPGIPDENKEIIFEPFVRLPNQNQPAGYGLGLAITKKIIALHQWDIAVSDSKLGGAKITISL